jgi:AraC-like DNA-binding protein
MCYGTGHRFRISSHQMESENPLRDWHALFAGIHPDCTLEMLDDGPVAAELDVGGVGALGFGFHRERAMRFRNTVNPSASGGPGDTVLFLALSGHQRFDHGGRSGDLSPGAAMFGFGALPSAIESVTAASSITVSLPPDAIRDRFPDLERIAGLMLAADWAEMRLLGAYLDALRFARDLDSAGVAAMVTRQLTDLVLAALSRAAGEPLPDDVAGGVAGARMRLVEEIIRRHHADPLLNARRIAAIAGHSPRYVQMLLARKGTTVTEAIHAARLEAALEKLTSPGWSHRRISEIAYAVGYTDPSHFVRVFRRRYGTTPSGMRA